MTMTTLLTAAADNLVAVVHNASIGHSRLSIPVYDTNIGVLQSTLTCALPQSGNGNVVVKKLLFSSPQYITVLFSDNSTIVIWNVTRGVVVHTLKLDGCVYDISSGNDAADAALYVLTTKKSKLYIHQYSLETGKVVRKIKCGMHVDSSSSSKSEASLAVSEEYVAVRQDERVRILSLENGTKVAKLKVSGGSLIMRMNGSRLALATSTGVVLYSIETPESPVGQIFIQQHPICSMDIVENMILVDSTALYEWPSSTKKEPLKPVTTISTSSQVETARLLFSSLETNNDLVAVLHSASKGIHVQRVSYVDDGDNESMMEKVIVGYPSEEKDNDAPKVTKRSKQSVTTTLGPGQAGGEALQASDARPVKKPKVASDDELTIAERLHQLAQEMERDDDEEEEALPKATFNTKKATTESLSNLLKQALESGDDAMLELSLGVRDKRVIATSLHELDASLVSLLLTKLTFRLSNKPNRAAELSLWISLLLESGKIHQTQQLRPLRNLLQERVESFPHLLKLEGRLSILAAMK